ncbi:MAG: FtsX-like permease family protein [Bacteroidales bacterium]
MSYTLFIAVRYFWSKKQKKIINYISNISVGGVAIGTLGLILVMSVFNGFDSLVRSFYSEFNADLTVLPIQGKSFVPNHDMLIAIQTIDGVAHSTKVIEDNALLRYGESQIVAKVKGVPNDYFATSGLSKCLQYGDAKISDEGADQGICGRNVAVSLQASLSQQAPISLYYPRRSASNTSVLDISRAFNTANVYPSAVFSIQEKLDNTIFIPYQTAQQLMDMQGHISALEIRIENPADTHTLKAKIAKMLQGYGLQVKTRAEMNASVYKVLQLERWMIFFILTFIVIIASFNILSTLTMVIIEKKQDVITLRSLGVPLNKLRSIFLIHGSLISVMGATIGLLVGCVVIFLQQQFGILSIEGAFAIEQYPVELRIGDVLIVFVTVVLIGFLISLIPARILKTNNK